MAEIWLYVTDKKNADPAPQDGDIVVAKNDEMVKFKNAERICHSKLYPRKGDGLLPGGLPQIFLERTLQYKCIVVSPKEFKRIDRQTKEEKIFPMYRGYPDYKRRMGDVMFGIRGQEIWYFGRRGFEDLDSIWMEIEGRRGIREVDNRMWPMSKIEKQRYLALTIDDFSRTQAREMTHPIVFEAQAGGRNIIQKAHKGYVAYDRVALPVSLADIRDRTKEIDIRGSIQLDRSSIVKMK